MVALSRLRAAGHRTPLWPARITLHPTCRASQAPVRQRHVGSTQIGPPCAATFGRACAFTELAAPSRTQSRRRRHRRRHHRHQPTSSRLRRATRFYATAASRSPPPARRASISSLRLRRFGSRERPCGRCGLPSPPRASRSGRGCGTRSARARCAAFSLTPTASRRWRREQARSTATARPAAPPGHGHDTSVAWSAGVLDVAGGQAPPPARI